MACYAIWTGWTSGTAATCSTAGDTWGYWTASSTAATSATVAVANCSTTWGGWTAGYSYAPARQITARDREEAERSRRENEQIIARRETERKAAEKTAEELLVRFLSDEQKKEYREGRQFHVAAGSGRRYRVKYGSAGNVYELDDQGREAARLCAHPISSVGVPHPDAMLAQLLMLRTDEEKFRKVAKRTPLRVA